MDEVVAYTQTVNGVTKRYYPHYNHLYSVAALTAHDRKPDGTVDVVERYTYNAYGKQTITSATGVVRAKSSVSWDRGFTGYVTDSESGLAYARSRMYSPTLGRFVSRDSVSSYAFYVQAMVEMQWFLSVEFGMPTSTDTYPDGYNMYEAYFAPNHLDPSGRDYLDCLTECVEANDPINIMAGGIAAKLAQAVAVAGANFDKAYLAALATKLGLEQFANAIKVSAKVGGQWTNLMGSFSLAISKVTPGFITSKLHGLAAGAGWFSIAYGLYMAQVEVQCACYCAYLDHYTGNGIAFNPAQWAANWTGSAYDSIFGK